MLIKPQELNQARLYAVETRISENEQMKMREVDFLKETIKKLIYAIEQSQISSVKSSGPVSDVRSSQGGRKDSQGVSGQQLPTLIKNKSHTRNNTQAQDQLSKTGGFFGQSNAGDTIS